MALLLMDTSTAHCAALVRSGGRDTAALQGGARGQDARLAPMLQNLLQEAGLRAADLQRISVIVGPGAFTGVRIGVAFARALALALGQKAFGINALDVFALEAAGAGAGAGVCAAGRGEIAFRLAHNGALAGEYACASVETVRAKLRAFAGSRSLPLAGSAAADLADDRLRAVGTADLSLSRAADLLDAGALPALAASPWYHRPPDARPAVDKVR